ncbi:hypothetical protein EH223_11700 [candidate division KSB1 bacterium]|nr:PD40 domain-containing protein [candidate division KSB1 bacterium]RQW02667.1 MAG: hypothetical protein EH223_11700 [candidate division KSB1 bacterium]
MRFIRFVRLCLAATMSLYIACTSPVEQSKIGSHVDTQELFSGANTKEHLTWSPDSTKMAYQTPIAKIQIQQFGLFGELLDSLTTVTTPYLYGEAPAVNLAPNGEKILYKVSEQSYRVFSFVDQRSKTYTLTDLQNVSPLEWTPDSDAFYYIVYQENKYFIEIIDPQTFITQHILLDSLTRPFEAKLLPNHQVLYSGYATNATSHLWYKDADAKVTLVAPCRPHTMTMLDDFIVYTCYDYETRHEILQQYSVAHGTTKELSRDFAGIRSFKTLPEQGEIQFYAEHAIEGVGLYRIDLEGNHQRVSTWVAPLSYQWTPDGLSSIGTCVETFSTICLYDLVERRVRDLTAEAQHQHNLYPTFTNDSKAIIFSQNEQLFRVELSTAEQVTLTSSNMPPQHRPEVSSNGQWIACDDGQDIYVLPIGGGTLQKVSESIALSLQNPTWSPDGDKLACESDRQLVILYFDGEQVSVDTTFSGFYQDIVWTRHPTSPFGATILFRGGGSGFGTINPETGVIYDDFMIRKPVASLCWAPNGRDIAYSTPFEVYRTPLFTTITHN